MNPRKLGWSNLDVSPVGLGCWAIGGPTQYLGNHFGWGQVDEDEAIRAIHAALDAGITLFDTADIYGTGHSERILGQALAGQRDHVLIATKFGLTFNEYSGTMTGQDASPAYIRQACEASLRRLHTEYIDWEEDCSPGSLMRRPTFPLPICAGSVAGIFRKAHSPSSARCWSNCATS